MTHKEWQNSVPTPPNAPGASDAPPFLPPVTDRDDPRLLRGRVHADMLTVSKSQYPALRRGCTQPHVAQPEASSFDCEDSLLVGGVECQLPEGPHIVLLVTWPDAAGKKQYINWAMRSGGGCQNMSQWRAFDQWGKRARGKDSHTGILFAPLDQGHDLLGKPGGLCPGSPGEGVLLQNYTPMHPARNPARPAFVIHQHYAVPRALTGCAETLVGPVVRSLGGLTHAHRCPEGTGLFFER